MPDAGLLLARFSLIFTCTFTSKIKILDDEWGDWDDSDKTLEHKTSDPSMEIIKKDEHAEIVRAVKKKGGDYLVDKVEKAEEKEESSDSEDYTSEEGADDYTSEASEDEYSEEEKEYSEEEEEDEEEH